MRAVSQRLSGSPPPSDAGVSNVAKTRSRAMNSRKSAYQVRSWWCFFSATFPRASNHSIVASRTRRVSSSKPEASNVRGLKRAVGAVDPATEEPVRAGVWVMPRSLRQRAHREVGEEARRRAGGAAS